MRQNNHQIEGVTESFINKFDAACKSYYTTFLEFVDRYSSEKLSLALKDSRSQVLYTAMKHQTGFPFLTLAYKVSIDALSEALVKTTHDGAIYLHTAAHGQFESDFLFVVNKVSANALSEALIKTNNDGRNALQIVAYRPQSIFLALVNKVSIDALNEALVKGWTALHVAAHHQSEVAFLTLVNKVSIDALNKAFVKDWTVLHAAARHQSKAAFLALVNKVSTEALDEGLVKTNNDGLTALHMAARHQSEAAFLALVNKVSTETLNEALVKTNNDGLTALHMAACHQSEAAFLALVNKVSTEALNEALVKTTHRGSTALHMAACYQSEAAFLVLVSKLDFIVLNNVLEQRNKGDQTPLELLNIKRTKEELLALWVVARISHQFNALTGQKTPIEEVQSAISHLTTTQAREFFDLLLCLVQPSVANHISIAESLEKLSVLFSLPAICAMAQQPSSSQLIWTKLISELSQLRDKKSMATIMTCLIDHGLPWPNLLSLPGVLADKVALVKMQAQVVANSSCDLNDKVARLIDLSQQMVRLYQQQSRFLPHLDEEVDMLFIGDLLIASLTQTIKHAEVSFKEQTIDDNRAQQLAVYQVILQAINQVKVSPLVQSNYTLFNLLMGYFKPSFSMQLQHLAQQVTAHIESLTPKPLKSTFNMLDKPLRDNDSSLMLTGVEKTPPVINALPTQVTAPQPITNPYVNSPLSLYPVLESELPSLKATVSPASTKDDVLSATTNRSQANTDSQSPLVDNASAAIPERQTITEPPKQAINSNAGFFQDLSQINWPRIPREAPVSAEEPPREESRSAQAL